ncbi:unnamed protein product [Vicia faba]|uniref:Helicase ATP-binding domain-containing protein n=1 Tax=Vicia faba TaxID=3906 RepID=A0AAV1A1I9_VICFA|nr:unnamed protein product [Vicia faba]
MFDKSVKLYAELAEVAVNGFLISKDSPVIEPIRLHNGAEENKEALRKSKGEEDEDFQILEYQAQKGNAAAMYKVGLFYYFGLRGLRRDHSKALSWFLKAVEKGEPRSMELLGEIYARGAGVERNYTKAFEWLTLASKHHLYSAYNGIGYLYVKGYGVDSKNYTKAKEYFEKAAENDEVGGHYNLGVMFLKGIGVKRDVRLACKYFIVAANNGQPKAFYQLAKIFHLGVGFKKNVPLQYMNIKHNTDLQVEEYHGAKGVDTWNFESCQKEVKDNDVMVMTPQTLLDALRKAFLSIETICLMVIDECHQASGNHPYAKIMVEFYHQANVKPKIFGMTASPIGKRGISSTLDCKYQISDLENILDSRKYTVKDRTEMDTCIPFLVGLNCIGYGLAVLGISKDEGNLKVQLGVVGCLQVVPAGLKVVKLFASTICWSMLLNSAVSTTITAQNSKIKKTSSSRVVPSHIGDSAGTTVIMGLDLNNATSKRMLWQCQP